MRKGRVLCIGFADDGTLFIHSKDLAKMKCLVQRVCGGTGTNTTVFQAECKAIIDGVELVDPTSTQPLTILVDNQAVVKASY